MTVEMAALGESGSKAIDSLFGDLGIAIAAAGGEQYLEFLSVRMIFEAADYGRRHGATTRESLGKLRRAC